MFKNGFNINNLQWLMCHKTKQSQIFTISAKESEAAKLCLRLPKFNKTFDSLLYIRLFLFLSHAGHNSSPDNSLLPVFLI